MRAEHTGAIVARGVGLLLILSALSSATAVVGLISPAISGWTSYSPPPITTTSSMTSFTLHDTYFLSSSVWVPSLVQTICGAAVILFSRRIGRWLASGLRDDDETDPQLRN